MRRNRVKVEWSAYYHVMSRCALQQHLLKGEVKGMFLKILQRAEYFSGVKVVNYCVMDNHFHLLVHVPEKREVSDMELEDRIRVLYGPAKAKWIAGHWDALKQLGKEDAVERERAAYRRRMFDISEFMKTFKQRFSLWYCSNHGKLEGTIWQGAFHSVLVEGNHDALGAVSAYITLNPVRAKLVERPESYRWSAYGAAAAGDRRARSALLATYAAGISTAMRWKAYVAMVETAAAEIGASVNNDAADRDDYKMKPMMHEVKVMRIRNHDISRGVAFGSARFVAETILRASNTAEVRTFPKAFCLGEGLTPLYCAGRHGT